MYKNIEKQTKLNLKDQVDYQPGQVVSKTLVIKNSMGEVCPKIDMLFPKLICAYCRYM